VKDHLKITSDRFTLLQGENITLKSELSNIKKQCTSLSKDLENIKKEKEELVKDVTEMKQQCTKLTLDYTTVKKEEKALAVEVSAIDLLCQGLTLDLQTVAKEKKEITGEIKQLKNNMKQLYVNLTKNLETEKKEKEALKNKVDKLSMALENTKAAKFVWKIDGFQAETLRRAKDSGKDVILYSEPFYTEKYGYKLKISLCPNGHNDGKNTHVSVYVSVLRGEYDGILPWPLKRKIKFILVDQKEELSQRRNIEKSITPTQNITVQSFIKPKTRSNLGRGYDTFVSHEVLKTEKYIVDGAIFLQVEMESS
jgi:hypothetical protein